MANLVAMNMKRKDAEVANHGLSIFLDPKRIKLQDGEIPEMMEEERPFAVAPIASVPIMASWVLPPRAKRLSMTQLTLHLGANLQNRHSAQTKPPRRHRWMSRRMSDNANRRRSHTSMLITGQVSSEWHSTDD